MPNIDGKPIRVARRLLIDAGWAPLPQPNADEAALGIEAKLRKDGITEVESCSGTGYGFCSFDYMSGNGTMGVSTAGA